MMHGDDEEGGDSRKARPRIFLSVEADLGARVLWVLWVLYIIEFGEIGGPGGGNLGAAPGKTQRFEVHSSSAQFEVHSFRVI